MQAQFHLLRWEVDIKNPGDLRMPFLITTWCEGGRGHQQQCHRLLGRCAWPIRAPVFQLDLADAAF